MCGKQKYMLFCSLESPARPRSLPRLSPRVSLSPRGAARAMADAADPDEPRPVSAYMKLRVDCGDVYVCQNKKKN